MRALFSELQGKQMGAAEGTIGTVVDILVDDRFWGTTYFVVDIEAGTGEKSILLAAESMLPHAPDNRTLRVRHSMTHMMLAPTVNKQQPVSKQYELQLRNHFGWEIPPFMFSTAKSVTRHGTQMDSEVISEIAAMYEPYGHLRSVQDLIGYEIETEQESVGEVSDIAFYLDSWSIGLFTIKLPEEPDGHATVPMSPIWINSISWPDNTITIDLPKYVIFSSPSFRRDQLNQFYMDKALFEHYREYIDIESANSESGHAS